MDGGASNGHTCTVTVSHETDNVTNMLSLQTRESLERAHDATEIGTAWPWVSIGGYMPAPIAFIVTAECGAAECGPSKQGASRVALEVLHGHTMERAPLLPQTARSMWSSARA